MNILYIHTHDTGRVISPYGYAVHSPSYQELSEDGVLFQQAFCVSPTCSPSRSSLLTGVYPHQNGMLGLAQRGFELKRELHLANILSKNGYRTALCGVQHEIGYYTNHEMAIGTTGYSEDLSADHSGYSEKELVIWDKENAANLVKYLESYSDDKPFFISYGMHSTHREYPDEIHADERIDNSKPPGNIPNNEITREDFARFKTSLRVADECLGLVLEALKKTGLYEKTIIIVTTDHGLAQPFEKCTLSDAGCGVLLIMRVPGYENIIHSCEHLISHLDIVPTIFDLIGISKPEYLEGKSFAPLFKGEPYIENDVIYGEINFHTSYEPARSVRNKRYKYIRFFDSEYLRLNMSNIDNSTVKDFFMANDLESIKKEEECLYDLYYDVHEKNNLANKPGFSEILNEMRKKLDELMIRTKDPLLNGPINIQPLWKVNKRECFSASSKNPEDYV